MDGKSSTPDVCHCRHYGAQKAKRMIACQWEEVLYCGLFEDISGTEYYGLLEHRFRAASKREWTRVVT